jgi:hypothetical protein
MVRKAARLPDSGVYYETGAGRLRVLYCAQPTMECVTCQKDEREVTLSKCPICFKLICVECARHEYGRKFCSKRCADLFFFGDDED